MNSTRNQLLRLCGIPFSHLAFRPVASSIPSLVRHMQPLATKTIGSIASSKLLSSLPRSSPFSTSTSTQSQTPASDTTSTTTPTSTSTLPPGVSRGFGTVISAGRMQRTVRVEQIRTKFDNSLQKRFLVKKVHLVSDPRDSLREGDKIEFWSGRRVSEHVWQGNGEIRGSVESMPGNIRNIHRFKGSRAIDGRLVYRCPAFFPSLKHQKFPSRSQKSISREIIARLPNFTDNTYP